MLGGAIFAELVGVPIAWLRLRNTVEWSNRPEGTRSIDLLSRFVRPVTGFAGAWALVVSLTALLVSAIS